MPATLSKPTKTSGKTKSKKNKEDDTDKLAMGFDSMRSEGFEESLASIVDSCRANENMTHALAPMLKRATVIALIDGTFAAQLKAKALADANIVPAPKITGLAGKKLRTVWTKWRHLECAEAVPLVKFALKKIDEVLFGDDTNWNTDNGRSLAGILMWAEFSSG